MLASLPCLLLLLTPSNYKMPTVKAIKCMGCSESITKSHKSARCRICSQSWHAACANLSEKDLQSLKALKSSFFICTSCESNLDNNGNNDSCVANQIREMNKKLDDFTATNKAELTTITASLDVIKGEMSACLTEIKSDIAECGTKVSNLEVENNVLHRRLNRPDIVVAGLPEGLSDLVAPVIALGSFFNIVVTRQDVNHVCYMNNRRQILIKFNSVFLRDSIMREYFKTRALKVGDIIEGDGSDLVNRVYLNDHFSPAAAQLNAVCRKLLRQRIVTKFKILNADHLKAKLTLPNGNAVVRDSVECASLLNDGT